VTTCPETEDMTDQPQLRIGSSHGITPKQPKRTLWIMRRRRFAPTGILLLGVLLLGMDSCTQVTNAGLEHLKGMTSLTPLYLFQTKVTDAGVKKLQQALPKCKIRQ